MNEGSGTEINLRGENNLYHPDQVITPNVGIPSQAAETTPPVPISEVPTAQSPEVVAPAPAVALNETAAMPEPTGLPADEPAAGSPISSEPAQPETGGGPITWSASEYVANQKSSNWYVMLGIAAVVLGAVVWLLTRDFVPTVAVLLGVLLLGIYAGRQPRQVTYTLDDSGITIGGRFMPYHDFRSFAAVPEGAFLSIELAPLKRFAVDTTIYLDPQDEDRIIDRLSQHLPMEEAKQAISDSIMRRIKF